MQIKKKNLCLSTDKIFMSTKHYFEGWMQKSVFTQNKQKLLFKPNCTKELLHRRYTRPYWTVKHIWVSVHDIFAFSLCYPDIERLQPVLYSNKYCLPSNPPVIHVDSLYFGKSIGMPNNCIITLCRNGYTHNYICTFIFDSVITRQIYFSVEQNIYWILCFCESVWNWTKLVK